MAPSFLCRPRTTRRLHLTLPSHFCWPQLIADYIQRLATKELRAQSGEGLPGGVPVYHCLCGVPLPVRFTTACAQCPGGDDQWLDHTGAQPQLVVSPALRDHRRMPCAPLPSCSRGAGAAAVRPARHLQVPQVRAVTVYLVLLWGACLVCSLIDLQCP